MLEDKILELSQRIKNQKDNIRTEEATKHSFVLPFLTALGYDVCDNHNNQLVRYFNAVSDSKFAILTNGIECRSHLELMNMIVNDFKHYKNIDKFNLNSLIEFQLVTDMNSSDFYHDFMKSKKKRASLSFEYEGTRYNLSANYEYI